MALGKYETIKARYEKRWVRDDQLRRYWELGCLTDEQYIEIYQTKYPEAYPEGLEPVVNEPVAEDVPNITNPEDMDTPVDDTTSTDGDVTDTGEEE